MDLLDSFGLQQHVDKPTHTHGHTLDLAITRKVQTIISTCTPPMVESFFSDHVSIQRKYLSIKSINMDDFHSDLVRLSVYHPLNSINITGRLLSVFHAFR